MYLEVPMPDVPARMSEPRTTVAQDQSGDGTVETPRLLFAPMAVLLFGIRLLVTVPIRVIAAPEAERSEEGIDPVIRHLRRPSLRLPHRYGPTDHAAIIQSARHQHDRTEHIALCEQRIWISLSVHREEHGLARFVP